MLGTEARRHYHRPWQAVASLPNPRRCRRFSHLRKHRRRDRTGRLGRQDSNLGMAESKIRKRPLICKGFPVSCCICVALGKECAPCRPQSSL